MVKSLLRARGSGAIPMTPFTEDDRIDVPVLEAEINYLAESHVGSICTPLMVSEFQVLNERERKLMIEVPCKVNAGRSIILCNVAAVDRNTAVEYAQFAEKCGADGVIAMPPFVGRSDPASNMAYYDAIAHAVDLPIMIQNHSQAPLTPKQCIELCEKYENITWVKQEIMPGPNSIADLMEEKVKSGSTALEGIMSGFGGRYSLLDFELGASATIHACQVADCVQHEWDLMFEGKMDEAREYHNKLAPVYELEGLLGMTFSKEWMIRRGVFKNHIMRNSRNEIKPWAMKRIDKVWEEIEPMLIWKK